MIYQPRAFVEKFIPTDEIKKIVADWIHTFSGDMEPRSDDMGTVYLAVDGLFVREQYVHKFGVFDNPSQAVQILTELIKSDPKSAISPRDICYQSMAETFQKIAKDLK